MYATTLPRIEANVPLIAGDTYVIRGKYFNKWPDEIVLAYDSSARLNATLPDFRLMKLVSKTDEEMVFEVQVEYTYPSDHEWRYFGTPNGLPRTALTFTSIG